MIHLSKFVIGIRHTRIFRFRDGAGYLIDLLIGGLPEQFTRVRETQGREEILLSDNNDDIVAKFNMDDWLFESRKKYLPEKKAYLEVDKKNDI